MKEAISSGDRDPFPTVKKANAILGKIVFGLMGFGLILPLFLPESSWLADSNVIRLLSAVIPSASKLAAVAQFPHVVHAYVVIMLTLAFLLGVLSFLFVFLKIRHEFLQADIARDASRGIWIVWLRRVGGIFFCAALVAFFYILPGEASADSRGSRGQLILSLIVMTKSGLAVFGGFISGGLIAIWFAWFHAVYSFFQIPVVAFQAKR